MVLAALSLKNDYWETFQVLETDIEFLYNFLLEVETPETIQELALALIKERIRVEKKSLLDQKVSDGKLFFPKDHFENGQNIVFPALGWKKGTVLGTRAGNNPDFPPFEVIEVEFTDGEKHYFASGLENHLLNQPVAVEENDPLFDADRVAEQFDGRILSQLSEALKNSTGLVQIAGRWFPKSLLVDVNVGHLNLAEAVLDMARGGPLTTRAILDQIDLSTDVNLKLTEFSLNFALQNDARFDEVGPAGEVLWFLHRLEPEFVQQPPVFLRYQAPDEHEGDQIELLLMLDPQVCDELDSARLPFEEIEQISFPLIFPHWRSGTIPLTGQIKKLFPTAYESPRVQFTFIDLQSGQSFPGWVVRPSHFVYGLRDWYLEKGLLPGSMIQIRKGKKQGEVIVAVDKPRQNRVWIRTILIGADGGLVFANLKHVVTAAFDERMVVAIPDNEALDSLWTGATKLKGGLDKIILQMMKDLTKLNPQGNVHVEELYAAVNLVRRCPPSQIIHTLASNNWANHLGNLYFRLTESMSEDRE